MKKNKRIWAIGMCVVLLIPGITSATELIDIMRTAITQGQAIAEVTGRSANQVSGLTGSSGVIYAAVVVIGTYADPTCKRLQVALGQKEISLGDSKSTSVALPVFEMNMCSDGTQPQETQTAEQMERYRDDLDRQMQAISARRSKK